MTADVRLMRKLVLELRAADWTLEAMAEESGIPYSTLRRVSDNHYNGEPTPEMIDALVRLHAECGPQRQKLTPRFAPGCQPRYGR